MSTAKPFEVPEHKHLTHGFQGETLSWGVRLQPNRLFAPHDLVEMTWDQWFTLVALMQERFMDAAP